MKLVSDLANSTMCLILPSSPLIDNLHLFLCVSDLLIDLLIVELRRQDAIEKVKKFTSTDLADTNTFRCIRTFVSSLGIPSFEFYIGRSSKELKCRSLTGPEKLEKFDIHSLLPSITMPGKSSGHPTIKVM